MKKNQTIKFWQVMKRFFEPVWKIKRVYIWAILTMSNWFLFDLALVYFANKSWNAVQAWDIWEVKNTLWLFIFMFLLSYLIKFFTRKKWAENLKYELSKVIWRKNLQSFFMFDASQTEKLGTGSVISVISKGIDNFISAHNSIVYHMTELLFRCIIVIYVLYNLWWLYIGIYFFLLVCIVKVTSYLFNKKIKPYRQDERDSEIQNSRLFVRMIMSKAEMIQNFRYVDEITKFIHWIDNQKNLEWLKWLGFFEFSIFHLCLLIRFLDWFFYMLLFLFIVDLFRLVSFCHFL